LHVATLHRSGVPCPRRCGYTGKLVIMAPIHLTSQLKRAKNRTHTVVATDRATVTCVYRVAERAEKKQTKKIMAAGAFCRLMASFNRAGTELPPSRPETPDPLCSSRILINKPALCQRVGGDSIGEPSSRCCGLMRVDDTRRRVASQSGSVPRPQKA